MRELNASLRSQPRPCGFDPLFGGRGGRLPGHILAVPHRASKFLLRQFLLRQFLLRQLRSSRFMSDARAGATRRAPAASAERISPAPCAAPAWWL